MYEVINEKLGIKACSIGDLTMGAVEEMLKQWDDGSSISTLTLFYDYKEDAIVLNRDNKNYDTYHEFTEAYLMASEEGRAEFKSKFMESKGNAMAENIRVLDDAINCRKALRDMFLLHHQPTVDDDYDMSWSLMREIGSQYNTSAGFIAMFKAFQYGVMQGKRMERARRKKMA